MRSPSLAVSINPLHVKFHRQRCHRLRAAQRQSPDLRDSFQRPERPRQSHVQHRRSVGLPCKLETGKASMADSTHGFILDTLAREIPRASRALFNTPASSAVSSELRVLFRRTSSVPAFASGWRAFSSGPRPRSFRSRLFPPRRRRSGPPASGWSHEGRSHAWCRKGRKEGVAPSFSIFQRSPCPFIVSAASAFIFSAMPDRFPGPAAC